MKRKDLINHDWKDGEIVYSIGYKQFFCYDIPVKVARMRVEHIAGNYYFARYCNKKDADNIGRYGIYITINPRQRCSDLFFTRKEAQEVFEKKKNEFIANHKSRLYDYCVDTLKRLDDEKSKVWGVMRMSIMNEENERNESCNA